MHVVFSKMCDQHQNIVNWLDEADDEISNAESILSDYESEWKQEISDVFRDETDSLEYGFNESIEQNIHSSNFIYGRNRYKWTLQPFLPRNTRSDNIILHLPGVFGSAKVITSNNPIDFWTLLFENIMIEKITNYTNANITELLEYTLICMTVWLY